MLCFASMDAIAKWLVADYPIGQMMWIRYGIFCVFAWLVVRRRGGLRASFRTTRPWLQGGRALLAVIESAVFVLAFRYLPLADTHAIAATSPLIVIALGALFLGEKVDTARWLAVLAGFSGVLLIVRPGFRTLDWPLLIPLAGALMWGGYQILTRLSARTDSPDTTLVWSAFAAFAATSFIGPFEWHWPDAAGWGLMLDHWRGGLAGALWPDPRARLCRGEFDPALQLHAARLGDGTGRFRVRRFPRPLDDPGGRDRRGERPLHLAP